jgi:predicted nucleotidyltransferase
MIEEWSRFKGWCVLEYFLLHPNTRLHINKLARTLGISPQTAHAFCVTYHRDGLLGKTEIGNLHQFHLNENDGRVQALKRFIGPYLVADEAYLKPFLEKNGKVLSVSLYGSFASGDYGDKSDLDLLVITSDEGKLETGDFRKLEARLGREVSITPLSFAKWRSMERKKDNFFLSLKKNNLLIWGNAI